MTDIKALVARLEACVSRNDVSPYAWARISEAAAALRDLTEWRDIATAPKDGECIVWCATDDGGEARVLDRDGKGNWLYEGEPTFCHGFYIEPTHWLPLPSAPDQAKEGV